jgi:hypothetical protein
MRKPGNGSEKKTPTFLTSRLTARWFFMMICQQPFDEGVRASEAHRQENIRELINFFPVIAEDDEGSLRENFP